MFKASKEVVKPLHLIIAEAALELVPKEIANEPSVVLNARKRGKKPHETLLDITLHYKAMKKLDKWFKRGRPDIVHVSMLLALSSLLNSFNLLRLYIHTINDEVIYVDPSTRIPRNYNRFVGLMEQLLLLGSVPPKASTPLMYVEKMSLKQLIDRIGCNISVLMHEKGMVMKPLELGEYIADKMTKGIDICVVVGGFQHGDFEESTLNLFKEKISLYPKPLETWTVISMIINAVENSTRISNIIWGAEGR
jgi:rRNA small subunit pseudouridine methyltransferase Nep1